MFKRFLSLPFSVDLTEEGAWSQLDQSHTSFFVVRLHFYLETRQIHREAMVGDKLAVFNAPKGASQEHVTTTEFEREDVDLVSSVRNSLFESSLISSHVAELAATAKLGLGEVRGKIQSELSAGLKESFSQTYRVDESSKERVRVQFQVKNTLGAAIQKPVVAVPVFQRHAADIQLAWIDYLQVRFERRFFGLRRKKTSYPQVVDGRRHPNVVKCRTPLTTVHFWQHLPQSCYLMYEDDYETQVPDPDDVTVLPYEPEWVREVSFPKVPTLYQIARAAFPHRWVKRKGAWTEDELRQIELEEAKCTPWWSRHGPGDAA